MSFLPAILSHLLLMAAAFGLGTFFSHFSPVISRRSVALRRPLSPGSFF